MVGQGHLAESTSAEPPTDARRWGIIAELPGIGWAFEHESPFRRVARLLQSAFPQPTVCSVWGLQVCEQADGEPKFLVRWGLAMPEDQRPDRAQRITILPFHQSVGGRALGRQQIQWVADIRSLEHFLDGDMADQHDLGSLAVVPVFSPPCDADSELGTLSLLMPGDAPLTEADSRFLEAFAAVFGRTMHAWWLAGADEAAAFVRDILPARDPEERTYLDRFCRALAEPIGAEVVSLFLLDEEQGNLKAAGSTGFEGEDYEAIRYKLGEGLTGLVAKTGAPIWGVLDEQHKEIAEGYPQLRWKRKHPEGTPGQKERYRAIIVVPVCYRKRTIGALRVALSHDGHPFSRVALAAAQSAAREIGLVVGDDRERARQHLVIDKALDIADSDDLDDVLDRVARVPQEVIPQATSASILVYDRSEDCFRFLVYCPEEYREEALSRRLPADPQGSIPGWVLHNKKYLLHPDMRQRLAGMPDASPVNPASRACVAVLVLPERHAPLVLCADSLRPHDFTDADARLMALFARIAGMLIDGFYRLQHERDFLQITGHQFGAPAVALRNFSNRAVRGLDMFGRPGSDITVAQLREWSEALECQAAITAQVAQALPIVFDVLEAQEDKARSQMTLVRRRLRPFVLTNRHLYRPYALAHARLRIEGPDNTIGDLCYVRLDGRLMDHVMWNLLDNAIKYSVSGSTIEIVGEETRDRHVLNVTNVGLPIRAGEEETIFEMHWRSPEAREVAKVGSGLGLTIARRIVELHGGQLRVTPSQLDRSAGGFRTTFRIELPKA